MKRIFAFLLSFVLMVSAQSATKKGTYSQTTDVSASTDLLSIQLDDDVRTFGKFNGLFSVALVITDTTTIAGDKVDSVLFFPIYTIAKKTVVGDTMFFYEYDGDGTTNYWTDSTLWVLPRSHLNKLLVWSSDPRFPFQGIEQYPFKLVGVRMVVADTAGFKYELEANFY